MSSFNFPKSYEVSTRIISLCRWESLGTEEVSHFPKEYTRNKWHS